MDAQTRDEGLLLLAACLRDDLTPRPLLLLGAGASVSSGVPSARACAALIARWHYLRIVRQGTINDTDLTDAELDRWTKTQPWYKVGSDLAESFPAIVDELLTPASERARKLLQFTRMDHLSDGYKRLAELVEKDVLKTILTTNFDECLPVAFRETDPLSRPAEINRWPGDVQEFRRDARQIVWLHGRIEQYSDQNAGVEIASLNAQVAEITASVLRESPLVVVGYRGSEPSIMDSLLLRLAEERAFFKHGIYWCSRDPTLHPKVDALARKVGKDFFWINITDFDSCMEDLTWSLIDSDFSRPTTPKFRRAWIDCLVSESLATFTWSEREASWLKGDLRRMQVLSATATTLKVRNEIVGDKHRYAKIAYALPLEKDFEAEIELSGDLLDLQLQIADGTDRNLFVTPKEYGIDVLKPNLFFIQRSGRTVKFGLAIGGRRKTLDYGIYEPPGSKVGRAPLPSAECFLAIAIDKGAEVAITRFLIRTA